MLCDANVSKVIPPALLLNRLSIPTMPNQVKIGWSCPGVAGDVVGVGGRVVVVVVVGGAVVVVVVTGVVLVIVRENVLFVMSLSAIRFTEFTVALSTGLPAVAIHEVVPFSAPFAVNVTDAPAASEVVLVSDHTV